ncbi:MAG: S-methyl-5'-thioinosine phosphorylase [Lysobacterales bacterium]
MHIALAVIGGSGLYHLDGLQSVERRALDTPYGAPSAELVTGLLDGQRLAFLARHGEQHTIPPHRVNYRANIHALHALGARRLIAVNAVGGIRADLGPRSMAVPDQIIDYTHGRLSSICDVPGVKVEHIDFTHPYSESLRQTLLAAGRQCGVELISGGCYGAVQGPRLETAAEVRRLRRDGCDMIGMTAMPEAVLARELGIDYAGLSLVANWAAGLEPAGQTISVEEIFRILAECTAKVPALIRAVLARTEDRGQRTED